MSTCFFFLALALCLVIHLGGCMPSNTTPNVLMEMQMPVTEMPTVEVLPSISLAATQEPKTLVASTLPGHTPVAGSHYVSPTVTTPLVTPDLAATPVAVPRFATANLTAAAPGVVSPTFTREPMAVVMSPLPEQTPLTSLHYVFPIQPPEVASYSAGHHDYPATDIFAPYRSVFVAVTDGTIDELSCIDRWDPATDDPALRGGKYVSLIGDDGVRYYGSHLDEVTIGLEAGTHVTVGTVLGYVGSSGNARGIAPHLHFGISQPTFSGDWKIRRGTVSPYPYLQAWARGENLAPEIP